MIMTLMTLSTHLTITTMSMSMTTITATRAVSDASEHLSLMWATLTHFLPIATTIIHTTRTLYYQVTASMSLSMLLHGIATDGIAMDLLTTAGVDGIAGIALATITMVGIVDGMA